MPEYLSQNDLDWQANATAELFKRVGVGRGSRVIVAFGYHVFAGGWLFHEALLRVGATVLPHGPGEAERLAQIAKDHEYDVLVSNPTFALRVAEAGAQFKLLVAAGEPFTSVPGYRERVQTAIGGAAIDVFGMSETGLVASETLDRNGLVPLEDMAILEVIDPVTLAPTPSGEKGELVITTLARELMPLIRFRTGDLTVVERLGNGQLRFPRGVIGRTDEMVKVKGVKLYPRELGPILASVPGLDSRQFQLVISRTQSGTDHLKLQVLGEASADTSKLEPMFRQALGIGMNEMRVVEKLEGGLVVDTRV
jgi:phenylacetate-CoA ligase